VAGRVVIDIDESTDSGARYFVPVRIELTRLRGH
jgi:hypothetical protein